jgi:pilus assembly protein CpaE
MKRKALITAGACGPSTDVNAVLARFGFQAAVQVGDRGGALKRLSEDQYDLAILPFQDIDPRDLLSLEAIIRKNPGLSVIATGPAADASLIVRAMRTGVHEFLISPTAPEELAGAVERLTRRMVSDSARGDLIAVYSGKGGLGTTSIAVNVAQAFANLRPQARVALADFVVQGGDVRVFLDLKPAYDLSHLVAKGKEVDGELLNSILSPVPSGIWALPTSENPEPEELFDAPAIASILELLRANFSMTVVDCEHYLSDRTLTVLDAADRILLVTELSVASLRSMQRTLGLCRRLGYSDNKLCVIVNRYQSGDVLPLKDAEELLGWPVFWSLPNDYRLSSAALTRGVPIAVEDANSKLARSYADLASKLGGAPGPRIAGRNCGRNASVIRTWFGKESSGGNVS